MNAQPTFFDRVVQASGLNEVVAPFTISRLLIRADAQPDALSPADLARALPELEQGIRVYLTEEEAQKAVGKLRALAGEPV
jgi:hypothetical protein